MGLLDIFDNIVDGIIDARDEAESRREEQKMRKEWARDCIRHAKEYIQYGKERYDNAYSNLQSNIEKTSTQISHFNSYKQEVARKLDSDIKPTITRFQQFNVSSRIEVPDITISSSHFDLSNIGPSVSSVTGMSRPSILDLFFDDDDYEEAKEKEREALEFRTEMIEKANELSNYSGRLREIRGVLETLESESDTLISRLEPIISRLNAAMTKSSFTQEEADALTNCCKIANFLVQELDKPCYDDDFKIKSRFKSSLEKIQSINNSLPTAPTTIDYELKQFLKATAGSIVVH